MLVLALLVYDGRDWWKRKGMIDDGEMNRIKKQCRPPLFTYAHTSLVSASDDDENHHETMK